MGGLVVFDSSAATARSATVTLYVDGLLRYPVKSLAVEPLSTTQTNSPIWMLTEI